MVCITRLPMRTKTGSVVVAGATSWIDRIGDANPGIGAAAPHGQSDRKFAFLLVVKESNLFKGYQESGHTDQNIELLFYRKNMIIRALIIEIN